MTNFSSYGIIIGASIIVILSFFFNELSRKTNIPAVLMLIVLGILIKFGMNYLKIPEINFFPLLELLGIIGLIMIVLEAALELELKKEKIIPILKAMIVAVIGFFASAWLTSLILKHFYPDISIQKAWIYATPISILSSAIIIPSVKNLKASKKEFHIYESTFSDILGIMFFYFLTEQLNSETGKTEETLIFFGKLGITLVISFIMSYALILVFQNIKTHVKLFLLISVLLLLYSIGKEMHFSSLIIILVFGLLIANIKLFFSGKLGKYLNAEKAKGVYNGLHILTGETAFVVRTFFFVIFGITIVLSSLTDIKVVTISVLILASIYITRYLLLRIFIGREIFQQIFIAPRGLITILLFYAIPKEAEIEAFNTGILLFIIIASGILMTIAMVIAKYRSEKEIRKTDKLEIGYKKWKVLKSELPED
jgi:NhaP-type Na+/H+ or K+/H+ antiporter